jgi:hypothetical protein
MENTTQPQLLTQPVYTESGTGYCVGGVVALVVGFFFFGIICGPLAIYLGSVGIKRGATTFGTVVKYCGWAEIGLSIIGIIAMVAAHAGMR